MEELYMNMIKFFSAYGWQMTVLAVSGIFLLGVLKSVKAFDWIKIYSTVDGAKTLNEPKTKQLKKVVYTVISAGLSVAACCVYLTIINTELTATLILTISGTIWSMNTITYMLYENLGVRAVWKAFLAKIYDLFILIKNTTKAKAEANKARKLLTSAAVSDTEIEQAIQYFESVVAKLKNRKTTK